MRPSVELKKTRPSSVRLRPPGARVASPVGCSPVGLQEMQASFLRQLGAGVEAVELVMGGVVITGEGQGRGEDGIVPRRI